MVDATNPNLCCKNIMNSQFLWPPFRFIFICCLIVYLINSSIHWWSGHVRNIRAIMIKNPEQLLSMILRTAWQNWNSVWLPSGVAIHIPGEYGFLSSQCISRWRVNVITYCEFIHVTNDTPTNRQRWQWNGLALLYGNCHDDVIKWKHFSRYWPPVPGEFPEQRPVTRSFDVFFDLRPNKRLSKQSWGWWFETLSCSLWRHYNVLHQQRKKGFHQVHKSWLYSF